MKNRVNGLVLYTAFSIVLFSNSHFGFSQSSATYYVDGSVGSDANNGLSPSTPWKTLGKVNQSTMPAGSNVLLQRGQTFMGPLRPQTSGISYGAYGSGASPVISGFTTLNSWTPLGNGIYESACSSCGTKLNLVTINDSLKAMGRYPNATDPNGGYLTVDSHVGGMSISDMSLGSSPGWTSAEVVIKKNSWILDRGLITSHTGSIISYISLEPNPYQAQDGYGYFIQNSAATLDQFGEWFYDKSAKKLRMFFGSSNPANYLLRAGVIDTLVYINGLNNIQFSNLSFEGSDESSFIIQNVNNISLQNCSINFSGYYAVKASSVNNFVFNNSTISNTNNSALETYNCSQMVVTNNTITNTGMFPGMGGTVAQPYKALVIQGSENLVQGNKIFNTGYMPIMFFGNSTIVKNNFIDHFGTVLDDGAGVYTWGSAVQQGSKIIGNIILHGLGAPQGTPYPDGEAAGIYTDDRSANLIIDSNTVAYCAKAGLYLHNSHEIGLKDNTFFDNRTQVFMNHDAGHPADPIRNISFRDNISFAKESFQSVMQFGSIQNDFGTYGSFDNNIYAKPIDNNGIIKTQNGSSISYFDLSLWKSRYSSYDGNSRESPVTITPYQVSNTIGGNKFANGSLTSNINGIFSSFVPGGTYGWVGTGLDAGSLKINTTSPADVNTHVGVSGFTAGVKYRIKFTAKSQNAVNIVARFIENGGSYAAFGNTKNFTITPLKKDYEFVFTSPITVSNAYLIFTTYSQMGDMWFDNIDVTEVNAFITNPADSIRFVYNETSAPKNFTLAGSYRDVRNNLFSSSITVQPFCSAVLIRVSGSGSTNLPPVARAGTDTVGLYPVSSILLDGTSSTDPDGSIVSYAWNKISGPSQYSLLNGNSAAPVLSNLTVGVYSFRLVVTDNNGANASDTVTAIINASILPITLTSFEARAENDLIRLKWSVVSTSDNAGYEIQRSHDNSSTFSKVGWVNGKKQTPGTLLNYSFADLQVQPGIVYNYRLKQVNKDGSENYSPIRWASLPQTQNAVLRFLPNPVISGFTLLLPDNQDISGKIAIRIIDPRGIVQLDMQTTFLPGSKIYIDASRLPAGNYYIVVFQNRQVLFQKSFQKS
jgi:hypothetical protein